MRILQLNSGTEINGAIMHTYLLSRQLRDLGHEVSVVCRPGYWLWKHLEGTGIERVPSQMVRRPWEVWRIARFVRRRQVDVIHTHMSRAHMFGLLLRMATSVPCVATAHNRHFQLHWRWNDFVIANSDATREFQIRVNRVPAQRIRTIYCASDLGRFQAVDHETRRQTRRELGVNDQRPLIGIIGEVVKRKGHIYLVRALPEIVRAFPDAQIALVGRFKRRERETQELRDFLAEQKLYRKIIWIGRRNNVQDFMAAMDVCVVPSLEEPLGLVAMEAQAAGTPVVVSDTGGLTEIVTHQQNGLVVPVRDVGAIAAGVIRLLSDSDLAAELVANGRRTVAERFAPEKLARQVAEVLDSVRRRRAAA